MDFSLMTLGSASARPTSSRFPSAHSLTVGGRLFLIDCGEGCQMQMARFKVPFSRLDNIFISHLHGDHVFGLFGLISTLDMTGRLSPLHIYAPAGMDGLLKTISDYFGQVKFEVVLHTVKCSEPTLVAEFKNLEIYAFPLRHRIETYGYLFKEKEPQMNVLKSAIPEYKLTLEEIAMLKRGEDVLRKSADGKEVVLKCEDLAYKPFEPRCFAYCSDTAPFPKLPEWIKGADLIYHEATYASDLRALSRTTAHSTSQDAAKTALAAGAKTLVLGHFSSRYRSLDLLLDEARQIFPESYLAEEGMIFDVPEKTSPKKLL
ncbi:MAG: ribonuclease Z [Bacteroidales bacterium]|nr:ribonuclease Z [Bacteroidales bacterium]